MELANLLKNVFAFLEELDLIDIEMIDEKRFYEIVENIFQSKMWLGVRVKLVGPDTHYISKKSFSDSHFVFLFHFLAYKVLDVYFSSKAGPMHFAAFAESNYDIIKTIDIVRKEFKSFKSEISSLPIVDD